MTTPSLSRRRPRPSVFSRTLAVALAAAVLTAPLAARAADPPAASPGQSTALVLFEEGRRLMEAKRYAEACPKLEESLRLRPGTGTLLNLALCNESLGKTATAWAQFKEVQFAAKRDSNEAREAFAQEHINALAPKLSRLQINAEATPGLVIRRDGQEIPAAALGTPLPVDPGAHTLEATAPGYSAWSTSVEIGPAADTKTVAVPKLTPLAQPAEPVKATTPAPDVPDVDAGANDGAGTRRTFGFVLGGVGIAALGAGAVFGVMAANQTRRAEEDPTLCPGKQCTPAGRAEIDAADTKALVSTLGVGVGLAAVGAGVVLILTSGSSAHAEGTATARVVPAIGPGGGGLHVLGSF